MAHGTRDQKAAENESEHRTKPAAQHDGAQDRMIAHSGGDQEAYANTLRGQHGAMAHQGVAALHAQFGNAYAMQVMGHVEGEAHEGARGTPSGAGKGPSVAELEKELVALRNRYDARTRALSESEDEVQNNAAVVPGDPGVEHKVNEPIVSGNRLLEDTKHEIERLEYAKSLEKAGSSRWNKLNGMQHELMRSATAFSEQVWRYRQLLKQRGFKVQNQEPFP